MLLEKKDLDTANITTLPAETKTEILAIKDSIKLDHESISSYSQGVTNTDSYFITNVFNSFVLNNFLHKVGFFSVKVCVSSVFNSP